jgi:dihydrolipoamide dehydrogenase
MRKTGGKQGEAGCFKCEWGHEVEDLARTIHAHPTLAEALMETAHKALGAGLHGLKE